MKQIIFTLVVLLCLTACERSVSSSSDGGAGSSSPENLVGGSTARFASVGDFLYTLSGRDIQIFNIKEPENPFVWSHISVSWDIETLFPFMDYLIIGALTGITIYEDAASGSPSYLAELRHFRSCDPVVAQGNIAFVTLRSSGFFCGNGLNQLDVVDISDLMNPIVIKSYPMQEPQGLGIDGNVLFICDGKAGLKVFNVEDPMSITLIDQLDIRCFDVIARDGLLMTTGESGLIQFNYLEFPMTKLSEISLIGAPD